MSPKCFRNQGSLPGGFRAVFWGGSVVCVTSGAGALFGNGEVFIRTISQRDAQQTAVRGFETSLLTLRPESTLARCTARGEGKEAKGSVRKSPFGL